MFVPPSASCVRRGVYVVKLLIIIKKRIPIIILISIKIFTTGLNKWIIDSAKFITSAIVGSYLFERINSYFKWIALFVCFKLRRITHGVLVSFQFSTHIN